MPLRTVLLLTNSLTPDPSPQRRPHRPRLCRPVSSHGVAEGLGYRCGSVDHGK